MFRHGLARFTLTACFTALSLISLNAQACTGIELKATDGSHVNGRTVEFGISLDLSAKVIPRNYAFQGTLPDDTGGMTFRAKYGAVGGTAFNEATIIDGMNEKGLSVGTFYFPGYAEYAKVVPENKMKALSPTEFPTWIITQFASVDEVKAALDKVVIVPTTPKGWPVLPPFHYVVYDKAGNSIVIEPIKGRLRVYDNPLGVFTNSPTFGWHLTNLSNYINLSPINPGPVKVDAVQLQSFGEGAGLHGLPGDFTPPSRFVRAALFSVSAIPSANAAATVMQVFHILNQFDIPVGSVRTAAQGKTYSEYTLATTVKDPQNLKYYFRTFEDQSIKVIDLTKIDFAAKTLKTIPMSGGNTPVSDITNTAK